MRRNGCWVSRIGYRWLSLKDSSEVWKGQENLNRVGAVKRGSNGRGGEDFCPLWQGLFICPFQYREIRAYILCQEEGASSERDWNTKERVSDAGGGMTWKQQEGRGWKSREVERRRRRWESSMREGKAASREASPRDHFSGKIRKINSQGSVWQKRK